MRKKKIKGKVVYLELEGGIWGIVDDKGRDWMPVNMPFEIMKDGLIVEVEAQKVSDFMSGAMWGTPIEISNFQILPS
ncbi:MAG TPA: hypothetical protein PLC89_29105 [Haliscomenobacter sp.]|uniref:Uncharacterized protein n=1 Tax=Haliscomenobacter hydrossis (strain ATCC 27775 / DSM 1100 / LMG 10767 / O) TaxID=760192 RepID=F4L3M3_HALH1|nr:MULTISPECIES: hypothetical protein [Haliscomenobacter]AEE53973.1 hypothetical protein Halhy_6151 [Haliscomenobacter hydrossis DSM 1100]HOY21408.1 hypothetical protein [Haliscomenobacter sp.]